MNTQEYLAQVRSTTGFTDYRIGKDFKIPQSRISEYKRGKATITETHAFIFGNILKKNPAKIIADTKLENAIKQSNEKKISFWKKQVENLKNGVASVFIFGFLTLSPVDNVYANDNNSTHNANFAIMS